LTEIIEMQNIDWYFVHAYLFVKVPQPGNSERAFSGYETFGVFLEWPFSALAILEQILLCEPI